jgi:hypothetical protein
LQGLVDTIGVNELGSTAKSTGAGRMTDVMISEIEQATFILLWQQSLWTTDGSCLNSIA